MEASPRASCRRLAWAWAFLVSVGAHLAVLALLLAVRLPSLVLPVESAPSPGKVKLFKVGMLSGSPLDPSAVGAPGSASRVSWGARTLAAESSRSPGAALDGKVAPPLDGTPAGAPSPTTAEEPDRRPAGDVDRPAVEKAGVTEDGLAKATARHPVERAGAGGVEFDVEVGSAAEDGVSRGGEAGSRGTVGEMGGLSGREGGSGAAVPGAAAGGAASSTPGPDLVSLVHARLAAAAERCYPASARRFQQRGAVEVRFCVDGHGAVREQQVQRSSGVDALDAAVGACVLPAASPFPSSASGQCFSVPVRFGLR